MSATRLTHHATTRLAQRGFRDDDVDLIQLIGTGVEDGIIVRKRDCQVAEQEIKRLLDRIRRLNGKRLVISSGRVVTAYRAGKTTEQRLMRGTEDRELLYLSTRGSSGFDRRR